MAETSRGSVVAAAAKSCDNAPKVHGIEVAWLLPGRPSRVIEQATIPLNQWVKATAKYDKEVDGQRVRGDFQWARARTAMPDANPNVSPQLRGWFDWGHPGPVLLVQAAHPGSFKLRVVAKLQWTPTGNEAQACTTTSSAVTPIHVQLPDRVVVSDGGTDSSATAPGSSGEGRHASVLSVGGGVQTTTYRVYAGAHPVGAGIAVEVLTTDRFQYEATGEGVQVSQPPDLPWAALGSHGRERDGDPATDSMGQFRQRVRWDLSLGGMGLHLQHSLPSFFAHSNGSVVYQYHDSFRFHYQLEDGTAGRTGPIGRFRVDIFKLGPLTWRLRIGRDETAAR